MENLKRFALVIGNFEYESLTALSTPGQDCTDVGGKLKEPLGFQVTSTINTTYKEFYTNLGKFVKKVDNNLSDIVFYYSGHGCSIEGKNYIIPVDGDDPSDLWASRGYVPLDDIINSLIKCRRSDNVPIIIILDCCRSDVTSEDQGNQGHNPTKDDERHTNVFILYATGSNQTASDGSGDNGTFTGLLLNHMDTDEDIEKISKDILANLHKESNSRDTQVSWTGSSLLKPYNFRTASAEKKVEVPQSSLPQEGLFWPKYPENLHFVDRPDVFKRLDSAIKDNKDSNQFRPIVLCGLGGMGKSQVALKFCYRNKSNYRYIFWMDADTEAALQSSFLDIAKMLNLPDHNTNADNTAPQMISWFHNNDGWLLIFDNCDDYSLGSSSENRRLQSNYFPKKGKGVILVTTRNNFAEESEVVINLDEMKMDDNSSLELLMRKKTESADIDPNALEVVKQLGHLPLAIDLTGALMKREKLTPADFLEKYDEDPETYLDLGDVQEQMGSSYGKTVLTVWNASFDRVKTKNPLAASFLRYIAFFYPDNIPLSLFVNQRKVIFKDESPSPRTLSAAANSLKDFSLVRRIIQESGNSCTRDTLTVHRLVQTVMLLNMESQDKQECYERLITALSHEISQDGENSKELTEVYMPHIRHVITLFEQYDKNIRDEGTRAQAESLKKLLSI